MWYNASIMGLMKYFMEPVVDEVVVEGGEAVVAPTEEGAVAEPTGEETVAVVAEEAAPVADSVAVSGGAAPVLDAGVNISA